MSTKIEWTDVTVNPFPGCRKVSPGCQNCYAEKMAKRLKAMGHAAYQGVVDEHGWTGLFGVQLNQMKVGRRPKMVFVQSMGDLFYEPISYSHIRDVLQYMKESPQHVYQLLTKRPSRAKNILKRASEHQLWPLSHVWLGVTCENQEWLNRRYDIAAEIPMSILFVSAEPLLGPMDFTRVDCSAWETTTVVDALRGKIVEDSEEEMVGQDVRKLDWVIVGCETGPGARFCDLTWILSIVEQCHAADVPVFVKALPEPGDCRKPTKDIDLICDLLGCPPEQLRQFPRPRNAPNPTE